MTCEFSKDLMRWTTALAMALALAGCPAVVSSPGESHDAPGEIHDAGAPSCPVDFGGELLSGLAAANSDEVQPGRPAVAAGGDRFLVVAPRIIDSYLASAVVGALVSKDRTVEKTLTIAEKLSNPIGVDVAFDGSNYLVVFAGSESALQGARLSLDGTPVGGPIPLAPDVFESGGAVQPPALAFGGGTYLVVYLKFTGGDAHVHARRISPVGDVSEEIVISDAKGGQSSPAVAFDGTDFLVVWQDGRNKTSFDDTDIYAARVAPDGTVLDASGIAVSTAPGAQMDPHAAFDGTRWIVAWFDATDTSFFGAGNIRGARVGTNGALFDGPSAAGGFAVTSGPNLKDRPRVLPFGQGTLVTWGTPDFTGNGAAGIFGAHLGADGTLLNDVPGSDGLLLSSLPEEAARFLLPAAASTGDRGLLVWLDNIELQSATKAIRGATLCPF